MNTNKSSKTSKAMGSWLIPQSIVIILASIISFVFVEVAARYFYDGTDGDYNILGHALGLIIPMCVLLGVINYFMSRTLFGYVTNLAQGIKKVADGNFEVKLDEQKAGPLRDAYCNFNKMGAELKNVQILRNDFLNSYSHEFKTPITSINGFANLLLETDVSDDDKKRYLQIIVVESARLADLANSTILMSKLNSQEIITNKKNYSLDEQLRQCVIILSKQWQDKNITISGEMSPTIYNGNAEIMQHLWLNLINNAIKYTARGGEIELKLTANDKSIVAVIKDTGIGMSQETIDHIYEKYYQCSLSDTTQGLGLGLSIVKRIVDLVGGKIDIASALNSGSAFTITLPKN